MFFRERISPGEFSRPENFTAEKISPERIFFCRKHFCVKNFLRPKKTSEKYFHTRPRLSQLAVWVSKQSEKIQDRKQLENELEEITKKYKNQPIPLPDYWGGYVLLPNSYEFWQGRRGRLHDRFYYTLNEESWHIERLAP